MATLLDSWEGTIEERTVADAQIIEVQAPGEAAAGSFLTIPVLVDFKTRGDFFTYLIDITDPAQKVILDSDRSLIIRRGQRWITPPLRFTMPEYDVTLRIEVWDEVPDNYPTPIL